MKKKDLLWVIEVDEALQILDNALWSIGAENQDKGIFRTLYRASDILKRESPYYTDERDLPYKERIALDDEFYDLLRSELPKEKKLEMLMRKPGGEE